MALSVDPPHIVEYPHLRDFGLEHDADGHTVFVILRMIVQVEADAPVVAADEGSGLNGLADAEAP